MPPGPVHSGPRPVILDAEVWARTSLGEAIPINAAPAPNNVPPTKSLRVMSFIATLNFGHVTNKLASRTVARQVKSVFAANRLGELADGFQPLGRRSRTRRAL